MMRRLLPCLCVLLFCAIAGFAQDYPKGDLAVGVTINRFETSVGRRNLFGFTAAPAINFRKWWALEGDLTYTTKNVNGIKRSAFTYLIGPRFTKRSEKNKLEPFVHALFGGASAGGGGETANAFAMAFGGGLDVNAGNHLAWRMVQADWLLFRSGGETDKKNVRVSTGLVFRF